tara:strand:+ start:1108 stop:1239 length:132 start_codon:yes stop_codon:yes gene_type:complete
VLLLLPDDEPEEFVLDEFTTGVRSESEEEEIPELGAGFLVLCR